MEKTIVTTGKTIDLAIEAALTQLNLDRDSVSVLVLQQAKSGFLGFGAQPAKVQVTYEAPDPIASPAEPKSALGSASRSKPKAPATPAKKPENKPEAKTAAPPAKSEAKASASPARPEPKAARPEPPKTERRQRQDVPKPEKRGEAPKPEQPKPPVVYTTPEPGSVEARVEEFLKGLLEHMDAKAEVHCYRVEDNVYKADLVGEDLGYLIGRRGDTLDAIQHLTNYAANRGAENRVRVNVDAEAYREKREDSLRRYARKKAQQVLRNRRRTTLEPMNAYERHIVHAALQDMDNITTHSTGVEPNRRVVIEYVK